MGVEREGQKEGVDTEEELRRARIHDEIRRVQKPNSHE